MNITNDNDIDNNTRTLFMPSPLPQVFSSRKQLKGSLFNSTRANGYILTTSRSSVGDYFILSCDRGGQYCNFKIIPEEERTRKIGAKKIGCMVSITGLYREGIWKFTCIHLHHNHPPDEDLQENPAARYLCAKETEITLNALKSGSIPRATIALLRETNPGVTATSRDVNNPKVNRKREYLDGSCPIQALPENLQSLNWTCHFRVDEQNQVINLMHIIG